MIVRIPTNYYRQYDADYCLEVPGEGFGGWKKEALEYDAERTAVIVMHAWDCGTYEMYPGWYRVSEWIPRAQKICLEVFPKLLSAVRSSKLHLFHVVSDGEYYRDYPGYKKAVNLAGCDRSPCETIGSDPVMDELYKFRMEKSFYGMHNKADIEKGFRNIDFPKEGKPLGDEGIAQNTDQLFALCRHAGVNHLIYIGFAINWCLFSSPGGMVDMQRRGFMCSAIRQAVTAVENRETARNELNKEIALWRVALDFGYVFDVDDFINAIVK